MPRSRVPRPGSGPAEALLVAAGLLALGTGCVTTCTDIACVPTGQMLIRRVAAALPPAGDALVDACFGALCHRFRLSRGAAGLSCAKVTGAHLETCRIDSEGGLILRGLELPGEGAGTARVEFRDEDEVSLRSLTQTPAFEEYRPNGDDCPPTCQDATAVFDAGP